MPCFKCSDDVPIWWQSLSVQVWNQRDWIRGSALACFVAAAVVGGLIYGFMPDDLHQAYAEMSKAWTLMQANKAEADEHLNKIEWRKGRIVYLRTELEKAKRTPDKALAEFCEAAIAANEQVQKAEKSRRDNLLCLCAEHARLLAQAESEFRRAQDAKDRGAPYPVTPRVRAILAPVLAAR